MTENLKSILRQAEINFNGLVNSIHKDVRPKDGWEEKDGKYIKICMHCGSSVTIDPTSENPINIVTTSRYGCESLIEEDRRRRHGK